MKASSKRPGRISTLCGLLRRSLARCGMLAVGTIALMSAVGGPAPASGQLVEGLVSDAETGDPLPGVALELVSAAGTSVAQTESDSLGNFVLTARAAGEYRIEATRLGYQPLSTDPFVLEREILELELLLSRAPLELDAVTVVGRRHDPRHDATFEGALVRKQQLPDVGPRRVILRHEPEMRASDRVSDVLRGQPGMSGCMILYQNGNLVEDAVAVNEMWLDSPAEFWEGVEYYRRWEDAPLELQNFPNYVRIPMGCTVVALWGRTEGIQNERPIWKRALQLGGILVGFYALQSLFMN